MNFSNDLRGLLADPIFQAGLGLLEANNAPRGQNNPISGLLSGFQRSQQFKNFNDGNAERLREQQRRQELDTKLKELFNSQNGGQIPAGPSVLPSSVGAIAPDATNIPSPDFNQLTSVMLQYGSPSQRQAAFTQLGARERFNQQLAAEEAKFSRRPELRDPVHSTQTTEDGRILNIHRSGKVAFAKDDAGQDIKGKNALQFLKGPGGEIFTGDKRQGNVTELLGTQSAAQRAATTASQVAGAKTSASTLTKNQIDAQKTYPKIRDATQESLNVIAQLRNHPGRVAGTGLSSIVPSVLGDSRNFDALLKQAKGRVFLDAFQTLKGGGTVTEVEGLKAEQAFARLEAAQTEEGFLLALKELEESLLRGHERALNSTGLQPNAVNDDIQNLLDKYGN